jgi:hypothetical protein
METTQLLAVWRRVSVKWRLAQEAPDSIFTEVRFALVMDALLVIREECIFLIAERVWFQGYRELVLWFDARLQLLGFRGMNCGQQVKRIVVPLLLPGEC